MFTLHYIFVNIIFELKFLVYFAVLSFMVKLSYGQLVVQQNCLWQRFPGQKCLEPSGPGGGERVVV